MGELQVAIGEEHIGALPIVLRYHVFASWSEIRTVGIENKCNAGLERSKQVFVAHGTSQRHRIAICEMLDHSKFLDICFFKVQRQYQMKMEFTLIGIAQTDNAAFLRNCS